MSTEILDPPKRVPPPPGPPKRPGGGNGRGGNGGNDIWSGCFDGDPFDGLDGENRGNATEKIMNLYIKCNANINILGIQLAPEADIFEHYIPEFAESLSKEIIDFINSPEGEQAISAIQKFYETSPLYISNFLNDPKNIHPSLLHDPNLEIEREVFKDFLKNEKSKEVIDLIIESRFDLPYDCITGPSKKDNMKREFLLKIIGNNNALAYLDLNDYKIDQASERASKHQKMFDNMLKRDGARVFYLNEKIFAMVVKGFSEKGGFPLPSH